MEYRIEITRFEDDGTEEARDILIEALEEDGGALVVSSVEGAGVNSIQTIDAFRLWVAETCIIDQKYVKVAEALIERYRSTFQQNVRPQLICFTVDAHWQPSETSNDNSIWKIDISRATKWLKAFGSWRYEIKLRQFYLDEWTDAQLHAAILSQLLRIDPAGDGSIKKYSLEFQDAVTAMFGQGYLNRGVEIPDVLESDIPIRWHADASGQLTLNDAVAGEAGEQ